MIFEFLALVMSVCVPARSKWKVSPWYVIFLFPP